MSNAFSNEDVAAAAEVLAEAIRRHAAVMVDGDAPVRLALGAIEGLRASARRYEEVIFGTSGWGPVFADLDEDLEDDEDEEENDEHTDHEGHQHLNGNGVAGPPMTLSVRARYDYRVPDVGALIRAGQAARLQTWENDPHGAEPVDHVGEAIYELFHLLGATFPALDVPELEPASGFVTVHRTTRPLDPNAIVGPSVELDDMLLPEEHDQLLYDLAEPRSGAPEEEREEPH